MAFIVVVAGAIWIADIKSWAVVVAVMFFAFLIAATIEWFSFFAEEPRGSPMAGWGGPAPPVREVVEVVERVEPAPAPVEPAADPVEEAAAPAAPATPVEPPRVEQARPIPPEPVPEPPTAPPMPEPEPEPTPPPPELPAPPAPKAQPEPPPPSRSAPAPASKEPVAKPEPGPVPIEPVPPATGAEPGGDRSRRRFPLRRRPPARETHDRIPPRPELVPPSAPTAPIAPEPSPAPGEPAAVVPFRRSTFMPREWNLWELERLARDEGRRNPARGQEWSFLFLHLRQFAGPDGVLPADFDGLVRESFGELLERHGAA